MDKFDYRRATDPQEAADHLAGEPGASLLAGGTDLLPMMKENLASPVALIDLSAWREGAQIEQRAEGLWIGAMSTLASIAADPTVRADYTALADACRLAAAPQLRNMGTMGGNLMQQTRCWYYRGPFNCWLKGGDTCFARGGENEQHAIFHTGPSESICVSAHPSDPAAALLALEAAVHYINSDGEGHISVAEFYALPTEERRTFTILPEGAVITGVMLPHRRGTIRSIYRKAMPRAAWSFALAGVAIVLELHGETIVDVRVALSGVAPIPIRSKAAEELLVGSKLGDVDPATLSTRLTASAASLSMNGYKLDLLAGLFRQTFAELIGDKF
jgi:xanthine dehydrogenase YagS FAD-binding subunit